MSALQGDGEVDEGGRAGGYNKAAQTAVVAGYTRSCWRLTTAMNDDPRGEQTKNPVDLCLICHEPWEDGHWLKHADLMAKCAEGDHQGILKFDDGEVYCVVCASDLNP